MITVNIGKEFSPNLVYKESSLLFRETFLDFLDNEDAWKTDDVEIELDFVKIKRIGPAWSNEVFAYFRKYASTEQIMKKIKMINITEVKKIIIYFEINSGYYEKDVD